MIKKLFAATLLYCCIISPTLGVDGTTNDPSQTLFSARQLGMGGVSVTFSDDANGVFSNPAGMAMIKFPQMLAASRKIVLDETQYTLFGWAIPSYFGTFGLGYVGMNTGGSIPTKLDPASNRIIIDPSREATSYSNNVIAISYAKSLPFNLCIGANYKMYSQSFSGEIGDGATGTGIDLGLTMQPRTWLTLGADLKNISGGTLSWDNGVSDSISKTYKAGVKLGILGGENEAMRKSSQRLFVGIDADVSNSVNSIGLEYFPYPKIAFRGGINQGSNSFGTTYGIGVINGGFRFDYAFANRSDIPGDTPHYFSIAYIGERTVAVTRTLKLKNPHITFNYPTNRLITDLAKIAISAEAGVTRILDQKTIWTVTGISETSEAREVTEEEDLIQVSLNNKIYGDGRAGPIRSEVNLVPGRNIINILGYTSPEALAETALPGSGEAAVLRFIPFADTPMNHWAIEPIALSVTLGLVKGYPNDTFRPERGITRAELVTLLIRSMQVDKDEILGFSAFSDIPDTHWASKYITYATDNDLVTGYPNGTFKPNKVLTRAEGITIFARYAKISEEVDAKAPFVDLPENYWANKYIAPAKSAGLLQYITGEAFEASEPFSRAEACEVLYRTKPIQEKVDYWWETGQSTAGQPTTKTPPKASESIDTEAATAESL